MYVDGQLIERLKSGEFPSRVVLAKALSCSPSVVTKLGRELIAQGVMDASAWSACFQTPAIHGQRSKDKHKRKAGSGTWTRQSQTPKVTQSEMVAQTEMVTQDTSSLLISRNS